ncbi:MAG: MFS transporter [Acidobacteria bacterium]|nr:MFS transporter [Acidobacteriota bacterium]
MRHWRTKIFAASWLLYAAYYFCRKNFSVVMPAMAELNSLSAFDLAHLVFAYSLLYSIGQIVAGLLTDRFGGRKVAAGGALVSVFANLIMTFSTGYWGLILLQVANGIGQGCGWSAILKLIGTWFRRSERGVVLSWWGTSYVLGGFLATGFATYVATSLPDFAGLGYRKAFLIPALVLASICILFLGITRERISGASDDASVPAETFRWTQIFDALRYRDVQVISVSYFLLKTTRYSLLYWLPFYLVQGLGYTKELAGYSAAAFELAGALGPLIAGYCSDRFWGSRRHPVGVAMLVLLAGAFFAHPYLSRQGQGGVLLSISLMGIFIYGTDLLIGGAAAMEAVPTQLMARAMGTVNCIGSMGQLVSSYVVAVFVQWLGWDKLFLFFVACALAAAALLATRMPLGRAKAKSLTQAAEAAS